MYKDIDSGLITHFRHREMIFDKTFQGENCWAGNVYGAELNFMPVVTFYTG